MDENGTFIVDFPITKWWFPSSQTVSLHAEFLLTRPIFSPKTWDHGKHGKHGKQQLICDAAQMELSTQYALYHRVMMMMMVMVMMMHDDGGGDDDDVHLIYITAKLNTYIYIYIRERERQIQIYHRPPILYIHIQYVYKYKYIYIIMYAIVCTNCVGTNSSCATYNNFHP